MGGSKSVSERMDRRGYRAYGYDFPKFRSTQAVRRRIANSKIDPGPSKKPSFKGKYYAINSAMNNPKPVQQPHPPITIGGSGEKVMLKLVAKYVDRWNCPAGYESLEHKFNVLKEHRAKRLAATWTRDISEQLLVCIGKNDAEVEDEMEDGAEPEALLDYRHQGHARGI